MQFIDLAAQQRRIRTQIEKGIMGVLDHGQYIMGPEIRTLEKELAGFCGVSHAVSCASGTDALLLALMACGVGPGDAVFTSPFTFIATAEVIQLLGATPVFVDIDPHTFNLDPRQLAAAMAAAADGRPGEHPLPTNGAGALKPKAVIGVDLFGLPADYAAISAVAGAHGAVVIEDAAQSFGAELNGRKACALAPIGCTSFFPAKPLGCYGDGGMCFTDDAQLAAVMDSLRVHGKGTDKYDNVRVGINGRMDTLQAAILLAKFAIFGEEIRLRQEVAERYGRLLGAVASVTVPRVPAGYTSVWAQYSVLAASSAHRQRLQEGLKQAGIPTAVYYPKPLHLQTAFAGLGYREGDFPRSEDASRRIFSLPMHPYLKPEDQEAVAAAFQRIAM
ncbi:MAG: DegT/DnrJ/EryC1/StrS family aminotransferase [Desulfobacterales bacterium]|nr:DegT/DnrJ/EryC1/StrS family aminotransferase [Desulfobacterales bacterium]